jgi:hypothetical protein
MLWSYFGSGHGKGVHDGAGAVLKQPIRKEQMKMETPKLQIAADMPGEGTLCINHQICALMV